MKFQALAIVLCAALGQSAFADDKAGAYIGAKVGSFKIDTVSGLDMDNSNSVSLIGGYNFGSGFSGELEYISGSDFDITGAGNGKGSIDTFGIYAAYRLKPSADNGFYFKMKAGFLNEDITLSGAGGSASASDTGLSLGAGAGFQITPNIMIEAEYTLIEQDVNLISAGLNYQF